MRLWSDVFREEGSIPVEYQRWAKHLPAAWLGWLARGTRELALIFEGITPQTRKLWVHWFAYKIPADASGLPAGYQHRRGAEEPVPLLQGRNSLGNIGCDGPQGTIGRSFRYHIRPLALDTPMQAEPGLDRKGLDKAINGHVLEEAELYTRYERPRLNGR